MEDMVKLAAELFVIVPFRDIESPPILIRASARSKTLPLNAAANEALWGVDGTVAWTAGPRAALWGVIGSCMGAKPGPPLGLKVLGFEDCRNR